jgi:hypothetical protein
MPALFFLRHPGSLLALFLLLFCVILPSASSQPLIGAALEWQDFERQVRDGALSKQEGERLMAYWGDRLEKEFPLDRFRKEITFPLAGYSMRDVGGKNGDGYKPEGYRFLDGNRHRGHPAQDIFVRDLNQDGRDDLTAGTVDVLALADGVVLSVFSDWKASDHSREIRGGNYIWIYHPGLKAFSYCAHLEKIFVKPGNRVQGGEPIATLGRTGKNASVARSPTHLHLMVLSLKNMQPLDPYPLWRPSPNDR